jgi:hypothetical protein
VADLLINTMNVNGVISGNQYTDGLGGAIIVVGQAVYQNATDGYWYPAQSNTTAQTSGSVAVGIALNSAPGLGQPIRIFKSGKINPGNSSMTVGQTYVLSVNLGGIAPNTDLASGSYVTQIGVAISASQIQTPASGLFPTSITHV